LTGNTGLARAGPRGSPGGGGEGQTRGRVRGPRSPPVPGGRARPAGPQGGPRGRPAAGAEPNPTPGRLTPS